MDFDEWLLKSESDWIKNTAEKAKTKVFNKMKMELAKLHILIRYGGVWVSRHYFSMESFDWITNIARYPSQSVFNRYGTLPSVFMYFSPHYGQPFEWVYDPAANTKQMWHIGLNSDFIAA